MALASSRKVAIFGGTGHLGAHITSAFLSPPFGASFSSIRVVTRGGAESAEVQQFRSKGAEIFSVDFSKPETVKGALDGIDVVVNAIGGEGNGHEAKKAVYAAVAESSGSVKLCFPSEFGIDYRVKDFEHAEWDAKSHSQFSLRASAPQTKICALYTSIFTEDSFGPWFGLHTKKGVWEVIGNPDARVSYTSLRDVGFALASLSNLPYEQVPEHARIAGDTVTMSEAARIFEEFNPGNKIEIKTIPLEPYKSDLVKSGKDSSDPAKFLRFLMGEGKLDLSTQGGDGPPVGGNLNGLVNPGGIYWTWLSVREYAKSVEGKPWWDAQ